MERTPTQLRHALRLVHSLQKERGASVSHYAYNISHPGVVLHDDNATHLSGIGASLNNEELHSSCSSYESKFWSDQLVHARQGTDVAFHTNMSLNDDISLNKDTMKKFGVWDGVLKRLRKNIDNFTGNAASVVSYVDKNGDGDSANAQSNENAIGPNQIILQFNMLITNVIDEIVLQCIHKETKWMKEAYGLDSDISNRFMASKRPSSAQNLIDYQNQSIALGQKNRNHVSEESDEKTFLMDGFKKPIKALSLGSYSHPNKKTSCSPPKVISKHGCSKDAEARGMQIDSTRSTKDAESRMPLQQQGVDEHITAITPPSNPSKLQHYACQIKDLLSLLLCFTQLKESTGVERSIVCCLMALGCNGEESHQTKHITSNLFSNLVVIEENQRMIVRELQNQNKVLESTSLSLLQMIEKFHTPGKEMEDVHDMIKMFDLDGLQKYMKTTDFWSVITFYIDQLHALELLIVEEFQLSREFLVLTVRKVRDDDTNTRGKLYSGVFQSGETMRLPMQTVSSPFIESKGNSNSKSCSMDTISNLLQLDSHSHNTEIDSVAEMHKVLTLMPAEQIKQRILRNVQRDEISHSSNSQSSDSIDISEGVKNPLISNEEWQIDLYEIEFCQRIGRGAAGTTYFAKWSGQEVAVKVAAITDLGLEGWVTEVNSLKRLHHPNVIRLLGSIYNSSPQTYGLVLEYCNSGDLSESLHYPTPLNFFWRIANDVANGMAYLHRKNIIHRDIKPANILLHGDVARGNFNAKLTDFGVAVMHSGQTEEHTAETGTYRWMAPEVIRHESYSFMADVYSYALVIWQLVTHETPFKNLSQIEAAGKVAIEGARPPFPQETPHLIATLIERCWSNYPDDRLSFAQITIELKEIHTLLGEKEKSWLEEADGHSIYKI